MADLDEDSPAGHVLTRLLRSGGPSEPIEEGRLLAALRDRMFGDSNRPVTLSRYVVLQRIATGGSGVVYQAYDPELDRKVAIKLLNSRSRDIAVETETRARLLREAQAMARLAHPNVIAVYDVGTYDEDEIRSLRSRSADEEVPSHGVFVVMELVDGMNLAAWLREKTPAWREVLEVFIAAGKGLAAAHACGVVHRDFKPANVLVGTDGRIRVLDFGLARAIGATADGAPVASVDGEKPLLERELTITGTVMGTPAYMAPEQHRGDARDEKVDQYAFCVALYEGIHGRVPFPGRSLKELEHQKNTARLPPTAGKAPAWLHRIIAQGLSADPKDRYPTMQSLLGDIEAHNGKWRRRAPWLATLGLAAGLVAVPWIEWDGDGARCPPAYDRLVGVWDPPRRNEVARAFIATEAPFAESASASVAAELDEYTTEWIALRSEACRAARDADPRALELQGRTMRCLDNRLARMAELVQLFARADSTVVEHAVEAVAMLPPLRTCLAATTRVGDVLADRRVTAAIETIDADLARAEALWAAGRYADAVSAGQNAADRARSLDHPATWARADAVLGRVRAAAGDAAGAERALDDAWHGAKRIGDDDLALETLVELVGVIGRLQARHGEADRLARLAGAELEFRGLADALDVRWTLEIGRLRKAQGRYDEALTILAKALELTTSVHGSDDLRNADVLNELGNVLDLEGRYEDALVRYHQALEIRRQTLGDDHPRVAAVINNIANVRQSQGRYAEARRHYEDALRIYRDSVGERHPLTADVLNNLGITLSNVGLFEAAITHHRRALEVRQQTLGPDHPATAQSHDNIGVALHALDQFEEALHHHERALALRRQTLGDEHPDVAFALNNVAVTLIRLGRHEEALTRSQEALRIREAVLEDRHPHIAHSHITLGVVLDRLQHPKQAREHFERGLSLGIETLGSDHPDVLVARLTVASTLWDQRTEAERQLELAVRGFEQGRPSSAHDFVQRLSELALVSRPIGDAQMIDALERARAVVERGGDPDASATLAFALARVLPRRDRKQALALAHDARARWDDGHHLEQVKSVDRFLAGR